MEVPETWDHLDAEFQDCRPVVVRAEGLPTMPHIDSWWLIY